MLQKQPEAAQQPLAVFAAFIYGVGILSYMTACLM
jgi:hypothetical protein